MWRKAISRREERKLRDEALRSKAAKARTDGFASCTFDSGLPCTGLVRTESESGFGSGRRPPLVTCSHGSGQCLQKTPAEASNCPKKVEPKKLPTSSDSTFAKMA